MTKRSVIMNALKALPVPEDFTSKFGTDALSALKYYLIRFGVAYPGLSKDARKDVITVLTKYLGPVLPPMPEDVLGETIENAVRGPLNHFQGATTLPEYERAYRALAQAAADLAPAPTSPSAENASSVPGASGSSRVFADKVAVLQAGLESFVPNADLASQLPSGFLDDFKFHLGRLGAANSGIDQENSIQDLVHFVAKSLAPMRRGSDQDRLAELRRSLYAGLSHFRVAASASAVHSAYHKMVAALVDIFHGTVKGYRNRDRELFSLAAQYGRVFAEPGVATSVNSPDFNFMIFKREELVDFAEALTPQDKPSASDAATQGQGVGDAGHGEKTGAEVDLLRENLELHRRIDALEAARIAYASEFPLTADGEPDVGSILSNIRKLKSPDKE